MRDAALSVVGALKTQAYRFWTGVPCSYLSDLWSAFAQERCGYYPALREDAACGLAAGAFLAGELPVVAMQNSGFASATNAIASLLIPCRVPAILIVSWRGQPNADSPEHAVMGTAFPEIVAALGLQRLSLSASNVGCAIQDAARSAQSAGAPVVVAIERGVLGAH